VPLWALFVFKLYQKKVIFGLYDDMRLRFLCWRKVAQYIKIRKLAISRFLAPFFTKFGTLSSKNLANLVTPAQNFNFL